VEENQTGNPVFDYRAPFRAAAARLQNRLICNGLVLFVVAGIIFIFVESTSLVRLIAGIASLFGLGLSVAGIAWGFYWRNKIRAEFRTLTAKAPAAGPTANDQ
jgi:hypothetical protein